MLRIPVRKLSNLKKPVKAVDLGAQKLAVYATT
jgi:hypothetical protein